MSKEIYVVNTSFEPLFLDVLVRSVNPSAAKRNYQELVTLLGDRVPDTYPLAGFFKDHERHGSVVLLPNKFGVNACKIEDGKLGKYDLSTGLKRIVEGEGHHLGPINLLVEFSLNPLYHDHIDKLAQEEFGGYKITKIKTA